MTHETVRSALRRLKQGKAPDAFGITSEHLLAADEMLADTLSVLFTSIVSKGVIPVSLKTGLVHPIPKKGKNPKRPDSYRRITVTSIIGKLLELILMDPLKATLAPSQSSQQRGFTDSSSSNMAALLLTEAMAETKDLGRPLYITFLDATKAFDVTWHASVFTKIARRGIDGNMWCVLRDWYVDIASHVSWKGDISRVFSELQGVRQGGIHSVEQYKAHTNDSLKLLEEQNTGFHIGSCFVGAPTCADDTALLSDTVHGLQLLNSIMLGEANRDRYLFSDAKTKIQVHNSKIPPMLWTKDHSSASWTTHVRKLLSRYSLPSAYEIMARPPSKLQWKKCVKRALEDFWTEKLRSDAAEQSSMRYLNLKVCVVGSPHHVWSSCGSQPFDSHRAAVKAKLLVGKYPLQTIVSRFSPSKDATCLLCDLEAETRAHFLLHCNKLQAARQPWMEKILLHHNIDQMAGKSIDVVDKHDHLGLTRCCTTIASDHLTRARLRTGIQTSCALFGAGFHGSNGLSPIVCLKLWDTYITPRMTFGLEAIVIPTKMVQALDTYQYNTLRQLQHLPRGTSKAAVHLLLGVLPMEGHLDKKTLSLFGHVARNVSTSEHEVVHRQLALKDHSSASWTTHVRKLLSRYSLPSAYEIMARPPSKLQWKKCVKRALEDFWTEKLRSDAAEQSSMRYLNLKVCVVGSPHHVWSSCGSQPFDSHRAAVKAKLLVGKYPLQTIVSRFSPSKDATCLLCDLEAETRAHFLLHCNKLQAARQPWMEKILLHHNIDQMAGKSIDVVDKHDHLGLTRCCTTIASDHLTRARLRTGIQTSCALFGAGFHGSNGLSPIVCLKLWDTYITPRMTFGLEAIVIPTKMVQALDTYQYNTLRQLQHLPRGTSKAAVHLLLGVLPMEGHLDKKTLSLFGHVARNVSTSEHEVVHRQLALKDHSSASWTTHVRKLLSRYSLPSAYEIMARPPSKLQWKKCVKRALEDFWTEKLRSDAAEQSSMRYLNLKVCVVGSPHHVWSSCGSQPFDSHRAAVKAKLLVGKYPLQTIVSRFSPSKDATCLLCDLEAETRAHFLLHCNKLQAARQPWMEKILLHHNIDQIPGREDDVEKLVSYILDPSSGPVRPLAVDELMYLENTSRRLCYALHAERSDLLDARANPPYVNTSTTNCEPSDRLLPRSV